LASDAAYFPGRGKWRRPGPALTGQRIASGHGVANKQRKARRDYVDASVIASPSSAEKGPGPLIGVAHLGFVDSISQQRWVA
jgi:hypothetical protein